MRIPPQNIFPQSGPRRNLSHESKKMQMTKKISFPSVCLFPPQFQLGPQLEIPKYHRNVVLVVLPAPAEAGSIRNLPINHVFMRFPVQCCKLEKFG